MYGNVRVMLECSKTWQRHAEQGGVVVRSTHILRLQNNVVQQCTNRLIGAHGDKSMCLCRKEHVILLVSLHSTMRGGEASITKGNRCHEPTAIYVDALPRRHRHMSIYPRDTRCFLPTATRQGALDRPHRHISTY